MREIRSGSRYSRKINPIYIYVAYEGDETEDHYFKEVKDEYFKEVKTKLSRRFENYVNFIPIEKSSTDGQPIKVYNDMCSYLEKNKIKIDNKNHFAFLVIDKDSHFEGTAAAASYQTVRDCKKKNIRVLCTAPCFELWLILHYIDISKESEEYKNKLYENPKASKNNRFIKVHYNSDVKNGDSVSNTAKRIKTALNNEEKLLKQVKNPDLIPPEEILSTVGEIFNLLVRNGIMLFE